MPNNVKEIFIKPWEIIEFLRGMLLAYAYGFLGILFLFGSLDLNLVFHLVLPFVLVAIMGFRNKLVNWLFYRRTHQEFYVMLRRIGKVMILAFGLLVLTVVGAAVFGTSISGRIYVLLMGAVLLFVPFGTMFFDALTDSGETKILFEILSPKLQNFNERQELLHTVFEKLENQLKEGKILISHDKLMYYFNTKFTEPEKAKTFLTNLEEWMTGNGNRGFLSNLKQIVPENEITPLEKDPPLKVVSPFIPEIIKYSFFLAIVAVTALLNPTLISDIAKIFYG